MKRRLLALALALSMILSAFAMPAAEVSAKTGAGAAVITEAKVQFAEITKAYKETYAKMRKEITPEFGNEWNLLVIAKSGIKNKNNTWLMNKYCANIATMLKVNGKLVSKDQDGNPVDAKITDYERVIILLSVLGKNPSNFYGCNLLEQIADYDAVTGVGINAVIYALLALDSGNYVIPATKSGTQATRKMYLDYILKSELKDGGFNWGFDDAVDPDLTGMAITALAPYRQFKAVSAAVDRAVAVLSAIQTDDGTFESWGSKNSDSTAWAVIALTALGRDPHKDAEFTKNGTPVLDALLTFYMGGGQFSWIADNTYNAYSTTESAMALAAYINIVGKKSPIFNK